VRILLPPSEGKQPGGSGPALMKLGFGPAPLAAHRQRLARTVERVARGPAKRAVAAFALPPAVATAGLAANAVVTASATMPALNRYQGVVYDGLNLTSLDADTRAAAGATTIIFSGLFGFLTGDEPVPDYRVPAAATLPRIGIVGTSWRPILDRVLPALLTDELVVDLRSSDYLAMWRPRSDRVIAVRMLSRRPDGTVSIVSHFSKFGKGRLARALLVRVAAGASIDSAQDIADIWTDDVGGEAMLVSTARGPQVDLVTI
jgi:cytoplasmic iron level regulating protein YaaA (DUF328/UPF0246 family)